jgi:glycosyltransferase involved in cell wall biosynthesis
VFRESALIGPAIVERLLARWRVRYVYDLDDAVWVRYVSPINAYFSALRCPGKTETSCRLAGHVMAGNAFLADYALRHNAAVTVVPTTIDTDRYRCLPTRTPEIPTIGWTGSHSTSRYLEVVRAALQNLRRRVRFRLILVGASGLALDGVEVERRVWSSATETDDLSDIDVGIMPLEDGVWERGKCGLKALQYMALGIPPVVSPVGVNREIVVHGRNGLHARTTEEWEHALETLLQSPQTRSQLGAAARATVARSYSAQVHAPRVAALFRSLAGGAER